jgi:hypothetical protein
MTPPTRLPASSVSFITIGSSACRLLLHDVVSPEDKGKGVSGCKRLGAGQDNGRSGRAQGAPDGGSNDMCGPVRSGAPGPPLSGHARLGAEFNRQAALLTGFTTLKYQKVKNSSGSGNVKTLLDQTPSPQCGISPSMGEGGWRFEWAGGVLIHSAHFWLFFW